MRFAILASEDFLHQVGVLELFIFLTVVKTEREFISPLFVEYIYVPYNSLVVITVVETLKPAFFFRVSSRL